MNEKLESKPRAATKGEGIGREIRWGKRMMDAEVQVEATLGGSRNGGSTTVSCNLPLIEGKLLLRQTLSCL